MIIKQKLKLKLNKFFLIILNKLFIIKFIVIYI